MAALPLWVNKQRKMLRGQDAQKGWQKGLFRASCTWMRLRRSTQSGKLPTIKSGVLPIRVPASQLDSYLKKGARTIYEKGPPLATNCHCWRNGPRAPFHQDPPRVLWPGNLGCGRTSLQGAVWASLKCLSPLMTRPIPSWVKWRIGPMHVKDRAVRCDGGSLVSV